MFPVDAATHPDTVRRHALKVGEALGECATTRPEVAASAVVVTLDSTFIRSCEQAERHLEVRVGNVETESGGRQVFGSIVRAGTDIKVLINRNLDAVGRSRETGLTAFTDGCSGRRNILADAGVTTAPFLDWFHIGMRLQHLKQVASGLSCDKPSREVAKAVIVGEVERLHWRLWNGKATNARAGIDRIHAVMHHFKGEAGTRRTNAPSRKLWTALHALDGYLTGQSDWLTPPHCLAGLFGAADRGGVHQCRGDNPRAAVDRAAVMVTKTPCTISRAGGGGCDSLMRGETRRR
jgi:hypothetical protein